jgi:CTP:phosphocholine cytidylyltransferase-like protein
MNIIILGDKFQKRMKSKGCTALLDYNKKPLFYYQYNIIRSIFPEDRIIYIYGFEAKKFESYIKENSHQYTNLDIIYNKKYESYNTTSSLYAAKNFLNTDCLIIFGDIMIGKNIFNRFDKSFGSQAFLSLHNDYKLGCNICNSSLSNIDYELENYIYNIYYIQNEHIKYLYNMIINENNLNCFVFELINKLIENHNINIKPFFIDNKKRAKV